MTGKRTSSKRALWALLAIIFVIGSLVALASPINSLAYFLGYGDTVHVEVTKSSAGHALSKGSTAGEGRIVGDGRAVRLYDATAGETVTARPQLIGIGTKPHVYRDGGDAARDLVWLVGFAVLGLFGTVFALATFAPNRRPREEARSTGDQ